MNETLNMLFNPLPNAIMTGLMAVVVIYWLFVLIGGIGVDDVDLGLNFDQEVDIDADASADTSDSGSDGDGDDSSTEKASDNLFIKVLKFMNAGKVPFMLILSTLKLITWISTLIATQLIAVTSWGWKSALILIPLFCIGIILTKFATIPMVNFFKKIGYKGDDEIDFLGRSGRMLSSVKDKKIGSAEFLVGNNPMRLNVVSHTGEEIKYGERVMVSDETDDKKIYFVTKEITI